MSNGKALARKVQKLSDDIEEETERGLAIGVGRLVGEMKRRVAQNRSIASGTLYRGIDGQEATQNHPEAYAAREIVAPDYWRYLEFGTGRGSRYKAPDPQPPRTPIFRWIVEKGIVPDPEGPYNTQWALAGAIAASLSTGNLQHKFARPAWRGSRGRDGIVDEVANGIERALARF